LVAKALCGAWRRQPPPLELSLAELDEVTPLLYGSGAAGLGWWRVKSSDFRESDSAVSMQQAYRLLSLQSVMHEQKIAKVFRLLRQASVEPILAKGWAAARVYPDTALRPYGDIDLLVGPGDSQKAANVLSSPEASDCWVDLHTKFSELDDRKTEDLFTRSITITLEGEQVRILSAEDQLALQAIHLLKHGGWRPLWLCDIAVAIESRAPHFGWDICLGRNQKRAKWITCAIGLAHTLLGAEIASVPVAAQAREIPTWLTDSVLKQWATPFAINQPPMSHSAPLAAYLRQPAGVFKALKERWPNPILATVSINGEFNEMPRLPYQIGNCALRAGQFLIQLPERLGATTENGRQTTGKRE
jgi:hypothetical protein